MIGMDDLRHIAAQLRSFWRVAFVWNKWGAFTYRHFLGGYPTTRGGIPDI